MRLFWIVLIAGLANLGNLLSSVTAQANSSNKLGYSPIFSSGCTVEEAGSASEPSTIPVTIGGKVFRLVPDTGSSNLIVGSSKCEAECELKTVYRGRLIPQPTVPMRFATGGMVNQYAIDEIGIGGLAVTKPFLASVKNLKIGGAPQRKLLLPDARWGHWTIQGLAQIGIAPKPGGGGTILGARVLKTMRADNAAAAPDRADSLPMLLGRDLSCLAVRAIGKPARLWTDARERQRRVGEGRTA